MPKTLAIAGLLVNLVGVLMLFRYGMPYRIDSGGATYIITGQIDTKEVELDRRYRQMGWVGLTLVVIGVVLQIFGALIS